MANLQSALQLASGSRGALTMITALLVSGCGLLGPDDGPPPPPDHLVAVEAACNACSSAQATHPCPPRQVGSILCSGIPTTRVGETMILCAQGRAGRGRIGRIVWSSNDSQVATVTPANLQVIHCISEVANAVLEAKGPVTTMIVANEVDGSAVVSSAAALVTVIASVD